jgi:kinetochor protein Mis14/NSL1
MTELSPLHAAPLPDPHHRKIELQSPLDLTYLQANLLASARQKLDLHFPPSAAQSSSQTKRRKVQPAKVITLDGIRAPTSQQQQAEVEREDVEINNGEEDEDPLRKAVREQVDAYITRLYTSASHSITVNGLDATSLPPTTLSTKFDTPQPLFPPSSITTTNTSAPQEPLTENEGVDFVYEAHDTKLQSRVAEMYAELESLTVQVGNLRRTAPREGAEAYRNLLAETMRGDDDEFEREVRRIKEDAEKEGGKDVLKLKGLDDGWMQDRKEMFERGVKDLAGLAGLSGSEGKGSSLTETVGRVQRAQTVAMEFE